MKLLKFFFVFRCFFLLVCLIFVFFFWWWIRASHNGQILRFIKLFFLIIFYLNFLFIFIFCPDFAYLMLINIAIYDGKCAILYLLKTNLNFNLLLLNAVWTKQTNKKDDLLLFRFTFFHWLFWKFFTHWKWRCCNIKFLLFIFSLTLFSFIDTEKLGTGLLTFNFLFLLVWNIARILF